MNKLILASFAIAFSTAIALPAKTLRAEEPNDTRIEKYEDLTQVESDTSSTSEGNLEMTDESSVQEPQTRTEETLEEYNSADYSSNYDVRRTEAFNLVSSAYRGDFEDQGINSYAVLITNYETGELTAQDLIQAAVESGELSPAAMDDSGYIEAVESQLEALIQS